MKQTVCTQYLSYPEGGLLTIIVNEQVQVEGMTSQMTDRAAQRHYIGWRVKGEQGGIGSVGTFRHLSKGIFLRRPDDEASLRVRLSVVTARVILVTGKLLSVRARYLWKMCQNHAFVRSE